MSDTKPATLLVALLAAQAEMPALQRDRLNPHFQSRYLSLETLLAELTYFGRAESLCHAEICETEPASNDTGWCRS